MKKVLKYILYIILSLFIFIILLFAIAKITEDKITHLVLERVSKQIQAPVTIEHVSFKLLRKFPLATIELNGVCLQSQDDVNTTDSTITVQDTILSIQRLFFSVKTKPLLDGIFEIIKIEIDGANINYSLDSLGIANIDFLLDTTQTEDTAVSAPLNLTLKELRIKNTTCTYSDAVLKVNAQVFIPEIKIKAKAKDDKYSASVKGNMELSNCAFEGTNLHLMQKTALKFKVDYDNNELEINNLDVNTDGAQLSVSGSATLGDTLITDLEISGKQINLAELVKYAPNEMLKEFGVNNVAGLIDFESTVKGMYADSLLPEVTLNIEMKKGSVETQDYPALKNLAFKGTLTNGLMRNNKTTQVDFKAFHAETEQSKFDIAFKMVDIDHPMYEVKTDMEITVQEFKNFIPDSLLKSIEGVVSASIYTKGQLPDSIGDDFVDYIAANSSATINFKNFNINLDDTLIINSFSAGLIYAPNLFKINNLSVSVPAYKVQLKNTSLDTKILGKLSKPESLDFDIKKLHIETNKSKFNLSGKIKNPNNPEYKVQTHLSLNLAEIKTMLPDTLMKTLSGSVMADINSWGTLNLDSIAEQANEIVFKQSDFNIQFKDVFVEMPDDTLIKIEKFSSSVAMKDGTLTINKTNGQVAGIQFGIDSTAIVNVYNTIIKNLPEQLFVQGNIHLGHLDYAMLGAFMAAYTLSQVSESTNTISSNDEPIAEGSVPDSLVVNDSASINYNFLMKGKFSVESITYGKVLLEDISSKFKLTDSVYKIENLKFKAFEGTMDNSIKLAYKPDGRMVIETHNIIEDMDIKKLLKDFDNFGDTSLTHENISGFFSTDLYARIVMLDDSILYNDIRVTGDIKLEEGGVYDFQPAKDLARFTNINELDNIQFKTLESSIFVFKNNIYVPKTHIVSTALDITAFGMQSLGDDYEYHLQIHLGDVLKGKSNKLLSEQAKTGDAVSEEDTDRNAVKLIYALNAGNSRVGFDTKKLQSSMLNKIRVQEKMLYLIFNPRLVSFDTDVK